MPQSFNCPNCSAPLDVDSGVTTTIRCPYCNTSVIVPEEIRGKKPSKGVSPLIGTETSPAPMLDISERLQTIRELATSGNKIGAIRLMRATFVIGLKDAKDMVESMQRGEVVDANSLMLLTPAGKTTTMLDATTMHNLLDLISSGKKLEAIKLFREVTGVGLKDAKDAVDGMEGAIREPVDEFVTATSTPSTYATSTRKVATVPGTIHGGTGCVVGFIIFILLVTVVPIMAAMTSRGGPLAGVWARVNPFAPGRVTLSFGKEGTGPGYFTDAEYIAVDNNGHIFVGEGTGGRVQVFDGNGNYLTQWNATGEETGDIYLTSMAAGRNGAVYTVVGSQLYVYDGLTGNLLGRLDHPDGWGFDDVTVAPDGSIVAAWYKNQDDILRFDRNGQMDLLVQNAIGNVTGDSEMDMRVAVDGTGNIYVLGFFNESVFVFTPDGRYVTRFGSVGDAKGQFTSPRRIAVDNLGNVYIADFPGVMVYASDGRYLDTIPINGAVMGITFDDQNNLYVVADEQVLRFKLK
jgi:ribosomal protein L7/L12/sugar lactone lactonase YvrE/DNA-directed RNA polymerase subunit RPC12/RpoP